MGNWGYIPYKWSYTLTYNRLTGAPLLIGAGWSWEEESAIFPIKQ